jgi:hypothetical protein
MPDTAGKYYLSDYIAELQARGFDGFSQGDLTTFVNRGYFHVARRSQWLWEQTTDALTMTPGTFQFPLWPAVGGELPYVKSVDKVVVTTAGQQRRLKVMDDDQFWPNLGLDLTATSNQGEPSQYYIFNQAIYILPPPSASRAFLVYYHQRVAALANPNDQPITPQHLDEAIILASLIRCHRRANEPSLAAVVETDLEEIFDDMRDDEELMMGEQLDRVSPDNTWL